MTTQGQFGWTLRKMRRERGLSQMELERRAGLSLMYVTKLENGKKLPSLATVVALAKAMDTRASLLIAEWERDQCEVRGKAVGA